MRGDVWMDIQRHWQATAFLPNFKDSLYQLVSKRRYLMKHIYILFVALGLGAAIPIAAQGLSMVCDSSVTLCAPDDRISLPSSNQSIIGSGTPGATACSVHFRLSGSVSSDCGIIIRYFVDLVPFDGSSRMRIQDTTEVFLDQDLQAQTILDTRLFGTPAVLADGIPYNSSCPEDAGAFHRLWWYAIDECGEIDSCTTLLRLEDCLPPQASTVDVTMITFPVEQQATIAARDLIEEAVDDCDPINWLLYSFDPNIFIPTKTINCDTIAANGGPLFQLNVWVGDRGPDRNCNGVNEWSEFNKVQLQALVAVEDDCQGEIFDGTILSENMVPVNEVLVSFFGDGPVQTVTTDSDGEYRLPEIDTNQAWTIFPSKTGDERDGVSTLDLIKIQKHLLGLELFDSPYKFIAADANNSRNVSAVDLLELQKLLLQVTSTLPNNTSWRFVPRSFEFEDPNDPWPFDEQSDLEELDFVGVKVGDLNGTVTSVRNDLPTIDLEVPDQLMGPGLQKIPVVIAENFDLQGLQLGLSFSGVHPLKLESATMKISEGHYAVHGQTVLLSWYDVMSRSLNQGDTLFYAHVSVDHPIRASQAVAIAPRKLAAEAYENRSGEDVAYRVQTKFTEVSSGSLNVYPNPVVDIFSLSYQDGPSSLERLEVFNSVGEVIEIYRFDAAEEITQLTLNTNRDWLPGVYILVVHTSEGQVLTKRVVVAAQW